MYAATPDEWRSIILAVAVVIMSLTGAIVLILMVWKGRTVVAQWKELKVTMNPERLENFSTKVDQVAKKMDEVVTSVNNKEHHEPTLYQTVKIHTAELRAVNRRLTQMDGKLDKAFAQLGLPTDASDAAHAAHDADQARRYQGDNP